MKPTKPLKANKPLVARTPLKASLKPRKQPKPTITKLKKEAKKQFNKAVKYRDSELIEGEWLFQCITCTRRVLFRDRDGHFYKNAQAGHFQPEVYSNTRFNEMNVNAQCGMPCNYNMGEQVKYARALDLKYGDGTAQELEDLAKERKQWTIPELQEIIADSLEQIRFYENQATT